MMKLTILGSCAASPSSIGFTSSQIFQVNGASYLFDCGAGTQSAIWFKQPCRLIKYND